MSNADLLARLAQLEAENKSLKAAKAGGNHGGTVTFKSSTLIGDTDSSGNPGKGTVSAYGLGRRPITGYGNQWARMFRESSKLGAYVVENAARLGFKSDEQRDATVKFFTEAAPILAKLGEIDLDA